MAYIFVIILLGVSQALVSYRYLIKSRGKDVSVIEYGFWSSLFSAVFLGLYLVIQLVLSDSAIQMVQNTDLGEILLCMFLGSAFGIASGIAEINALKIGTKSLTSAIINTALALSTIFFVVFWNSTVTMFNMVGIVLMIFAVVLMGGSGNAGGSSNGRWLVFCLSGLLFNTISVIVTTIPSQYQMQDAMGIRGMSIMGFMAILYYFIKKWMRLRINPLAVKIALVNGIINALIQIFTYPLLDALAAEGMAHIFTPIKLVSQILCFSVMTSIAFHEKLSRLQMSGMIMSVAGILLFLV